MKKQVLSALAFCSALGIAQAQTDVTKEYLVNPSFETAEFNLQMQQNSD